MSVIAASSLATSDVILASRLNVFHSTPSTAQHAEHRKENRHADPHDRDGLLRPSNRLPPPRGGGRKGVCGFGHGMCKTQHKKHNPQAFPYAIDVPPSTGMTAPVV